MTSPHEQALAAETPMADHVANFWHLLETETVRILVNIKRENEGMGVYWDGASFPDDVAKALAADRRPTSLPAEVDGMAASASDLAGKHERYMRAYFHEFTPTGVDAVDAVLEAIALAGKGYHYTGDWADADQYGPDGYWSLIQLVANNAAGALRSLSAKLAAVGRERDTLTERLAEMEAALEPFSDMAGELFARNWNASDVVIALDNPGDPHRVTAGDFFAARRALASPALTAETQAVPEGMAARDVLAERRRQIEGEGWTPEHDDAHANGELAGAAACYCLGSVSHWARSMAIQSLWPWDKSWWKPTDRRRDLVKAGALIFAEIDRLDRLAASTAVQGGDHGE